MNTKQAQRAELDREFSADGSKMTAADYSARLAVINQAETAPAAPAEPELFVTMRAMKNTLETVAGTVAPIIQRLDAVERKLRTLETKSMEISGDNMAGAGALIMAAVLEKVNATLAQPVKPIYDDRGILIGAKRVADWEN